MRTLVATLFFATTVFAQAPPQTRTAPEQGSPPRNLTRQADGHFSANSDPANPAAFEVRVVQAGDTLSGIARQALNNARLWPQLWETNEHVVNPHWIYPNDKILVRPVTLITEQTPEPPPPPPVVEAPPPPPPPAPPAQVVVPPSSIPALTPPPPRRPQVFFQPPPPRLAPEVKVSDLYCSGFIQVSAVPQDLKVIAKFNADGGALATDTNYIYVSQGSEAGVTTGTMYQVVRPTKRIDRPEGRTRDERNLGMHYIDVAQIQVVLAQPDFALARVVSNCDAVEIGDIMLPWQRITPPSLTRPRPFNPFMTVAGGVKGSVVTSLGVLRNFGSTFKGSGKTPGVRGGDLGSLEKGIGSEGTIVYIDIGQREGVRPGDLFIVYQQLELDGQLYDLPDEAQKLRGQRAAIGELVVVKAGERASTALVTYSSNGIAAGDSVERR